MMKGTPQQRTTIRTIGRRILMCLLLAGSAAPAAYPLDGTVFRLVVLGSSTAAGEAARPLDSSWVNKYRDYLGTVFQSYEVINLAVGGFTTFNVMPNGYVRPSPWDTNPGLAVDVNKNITRALSLNPSLILINLPTNDCDLGIPVSQQLAHFDALVQQAVDAGVPVYLSTTQPRNEVQFVRTLLIQMYNEITSRYPGKVMDFWTGIAQSDGTIHPFYNADGTHLNNAGHALLYERALAAVQLPLPVTVAPVALSFGNRQTGVPATLPVTITNPSASTLTFSSIVTGTPAYVSDLSSASAVPGGSFTVHVTFTPPAVGIYRDTLYLHNNSSLTVVKVALSGVAPAPVIQAVPSALAFPGAVLSAGSTARLALRNTDLNAGSIASVTSQSGRFTADPASGTVASGDSLILQVTFTPLAFGTVTDTLRLNGVVAGNVVKVPVTGTCPQPVLGLSASSLDFGDVSLSAPKTMDLTFSNTSPNTMVIDAIANMHPAFFIDPSSASIPGQGTLVVHVTFSPSAFGTVRDTIQVISNATVSPLRIPMRGAVPVPTIGLSRTDITFPVTGQGNASHRGVYVRNLGINPVTVQSVTARSPHFSCVTALPRSVAGADSALLTIMFTPLVAGDLADTLAIVTDAGTAEVRVTGSSPLSYLRGQPAPLAFGSVKVGTTVWKSCAVKVQSPDPGFAIAVDSVRVQTAAFSVTGFSGRVVLSGQDSLRITVGFSPSQYTAYVDTMLVYSDAAAGILRIPLGGQGETFTDVAEPETAGPLAFGLAQNYPNPFNPSTLITFTLAVAGETEVRVFDVLGREVAVLHSGPAAAGVHQVRFDAAGLPSGIYLCRLISGDAAAVRRMVLMK